MLANRGCQGADPLSKRGPEWPRPPKRGGRAPRGPKQRRGQSGPCGRDCNGAGQRCPQKSPCPAARGNGRRRRRAGFHSRHALSLAEDRQGRRARTHRPSKKAARIGVRAAGTERGLHPTAHGPPSKGAGYTPPPRGPKPGPAWGRTTPEGLRPRPRPCPEPEGVRAKRLGRAEPEGTVLANRGRQGADPLSKRGPERPRPPPRGGRAPRGPKQRRGQSGPCGRDCNGAGQACPQRSPCPATRGEGRRRRRAGQHALSLTEDRQRRRARLPPALRKGCPHRSMGSRDGKGPAPHGAGAAVRGGR